MTKEKHIHILSHLTPTASLLATALLTTNCHCLLLSFLFLSLSASLCSLPVLLGAHKHRHTCTPYKTNYCYHYIHHCIPFLNLPKQMKQKIINSKACQDEQSYFWNIIFLSHLKMSREHTDTGCQKPMHTKVHTYLNVPNCSHLNTTHRYRQTHTQFQGSHKIAHKFSMVIYKHI